MEVFKASVQYNDLKGTVAADEATHSDATSWLREHQHISTDEFVVGISVRIGENHGEHKDPVSVKFLVTDLKGYTNIPEMLEGESNNLVVKKLRFDFSIAEFLALFKRLEITLSNNGILEGKQYNVEE
ncbi:hypothetical protein ACOGST_004696 [Vibrio alginolyticus]|nr:hypothetical protein [Vibrio alginolyticus]ELB2845540.1 hypothetical protein [Vibrio alginolyticus]ELB2863860.1 hypothetical protein [Vibrio alginolyticus]ELU8569353.1 hypothetical protein [Vibrio alginolyticus]